MVSTMLQSKAAYVTPQRIGGRVAPTNNGSAISPAFRVAMTTHTPNMPRTHATICGAPKAIAIPKIAPRHHPHDIRFAMAMAPSAMIKMIAMGVSHARMFVWRAVAPVMNGELCACAMAIGAAHTTAPAPKLVIGTRALYVSMHNLHGIQG